MKNIEERNKLIVEHKYIADEIARRKKRSCIKSIQLSELKSAAYMGLIDAASKFDESKGEFKIYAKYRVYGEINDYLRKYYGSRKRHSMRCWSLEVPAYTNNFNNTSPLSEIVGYEDESLTQVSNEDSFEHLTSCLPILYKKIIYLYFLKGLSMKEIGELLGYCESRISQLVTRAKNIIKVNNDHDSNDIFDIFEKRSVNFLSTIKPNQETVDV